MEKPTTPENPYDTLAERIDELFCDELDGWCDWSQNGRLRREETFTREDVYKHVERIREKIRTFVENEERTKEKL